MAFFPHRKCSLSASYVPDCSWKLRWIRYIPTKQGGIEKPAIGQVLRGSLPWLTNDRDTKREKMTSVCFGLPWSEKCKENHDWFWTELGHKLKTEKYKPFEAERSEILNSGSTQHLKTLFNESFSLVVFDRCYTCLSILLATFNYRVYGMGFPTRPFHAWLVR